MNVPYERMPIGFFDKYYNEDDDYLVLLHNNAQNKDKRVDVAEPSLTEEKEEMIVVQKPEKTETKENEEDMKARILLAAQQQMVKLPIINNQLSWFFFIVFI